MRVLSVTFDYFPSETYFSAALTSDKLCSLFLPLAWTMLDGCTVSQLTVPRADYSLFSALRALYNRQKVNDVTLCNVHAVGMHTSD